MVPESAERPDRCCWSVVVAPINWESASCKLPNIEATDAATVADTHFAGAAMRFFGVALLLTVDKALAAKEGVTSIGQPEFHCRC